jgi:hypothetical protein
MADPSKDQSSASTIDSDEDGLTDAEEARLGTNPGKWDTDGDSIMDGSEVNSIGFKTNPKLADSDGDGLGDGIEMWAHTNPTKRDSDGDGMSDGFEVAIGDHPRVKDLRGNPAENEKRSEDLIVAKENQMGVTQHNVDTDGDGFADWVEGFSGKGDPNVFDMNENMVQPNPTPLDRFVEVAQAREGVKYKFGAEVDLNDMDPQALDSGELVQWAAHQSGIDIPDGTWKQYRHLKEQGAAISVEDALKTKGALVFGFSSDPLASPDRPARSYVAISLGNGRDVIDVSERAGEVRVLDDANFFTHAAIIPAFIPDIPNVDRILDPASPLQPDSDGDGMRDVDERLFDRDPFDPTDAEQDSGPITHPRQVDPSLGAQVDDEEPTRTFEQSAVDTTFEADSQPQLENDPLAFADPAVPDDFAPIDDSATERVNDDATFEGSLDVA